MVHRGPASVSCVIHVPVSVITPELKEKGITFLLTLVLCKLDLLMATNCVSVCRHCQCVLAGKQRGFIA